MRGEVAGCTPLDPSPTFKTRLQPVALQAWRPPLNTAIWWEAGKAHTLSTYDVGEWMQIAISISSGEHPGSH
jgi:hypothetical protein